MRHAIFGCLGSILLGTFLVQAPPSLSSSNAECLACHGTAAEVSERQRLNEQNFSASAHGKLECTNCHRVSAAEATTGIPHAKDMPDVNCTAVCHREDHKAGEGLAPLSYPDSAHGRAYLERGAKEAARCWDCHGAHDTRKVTDSLSPVSRKNIVQTCGTCHVGIRRDYLEGVHGKDYVKGIKDVPVCTDCHSKHDILSPQDLRSKVYATKIAKLCGRCHDNLALSRQYGFLTSRMKTYRETFHGTASKFGETRVANCTSCHGFHDIRPSSDPMSSIHPANLPKTCGRCHPGASRRFAEGQVHVIPEETTDARYKSSQIVKNICVLVITVIISTMVIFIAADLWRRLIRNRTHG